MGASDNDSIKGNSVAIETSSVETPKEKHSTLIGGQNLDLTVTEFDNAAARGRENEVSSSVWEDVKASPWAIFWCFVVSMCVIMEG